MLVIFNNLKPFFEDVYREIAVREYSRILQISPPNASKILKDFADKGVLSMRKERNLLLFRANREKYLFRDLAIAYWREVLSTLFLSLKDKFLFKNLILFGSIVKIENTLSSDVDLFVNIKHTEIDISKVEKVLKRKVQLHFSNSLNNNNLKFNIEKGVEI
ncbi:MAG: nucleotidyltransferase domain-containing protein [Nanoarchaeota archaeon]